MIGIAKKEAFFDLLNTYYVHFSTFPLLAKIIKIIFMFMQYVV